MGRKLKLLIVIGTLALALIIIVWQRTIAAQSDLQSLACEPGLTTWLSGTSPAHTPVLIYWDGRAVGGGSSDGSGHWALPLTVGHERPGSHMVEVRARSNRAIIGAFQCEVGGNLPTPAPFIAQPTLVPTEPPTLTPSATSQPEPTTVTDFTPEPTQTALDVTPESTPTELDATPAPTQTELGVAPQGNDCPPGYPIKGADVNGQKIYHVPGDNGYATTIPERCFSGTIEAEAAGYQVAQ